MYIAKDGNKDGFGYAYVDGDKVQYCKGLDNKIHDDAFVDMYMQLPFPKAIHYRLATHGGVCKELTHPFPIKRGVPNSLIGDAPSVLFHNGVWNDWDDRLREAIFAGTLNPNVLKGLMSDSRALAIFAQRYGPDILDVIGLGSNKVLILSSDTWSKYGIWTCKEGWSASNSRIEYPIQAVGTGASTPWAHHWGKKNRRYYPPSDAQKSMYLETDRAEIEETERLWREQYSG